MIHLIINIIHAKIRNAVLDVWKILRDAFAPIWAGAVSPKDALGDTANSGTPKEDPVVKGEAQSTSSSPSSGTIVPDEPGTVPPALSPELDDKENNTTLTANEEIVRLQRRIKELEKENLENIKVKHTLKELAECATIERESFGKVGRNRIPAQRVTFNLRLQWALLFELGVTTGLIMIDKTEFINTAVRLHLEYHYPQLYALYIRSITRDEQNELPSDHPPPYL